MTNDNLVSILLPVFNADRYLADTLASIMNQTYPHYEVIMVDDCSTDNSRKIMEAQAAIDHRFHCFYNSENLGLASTLNIAASKSSGSIFARIDADDLMVPSRIEVQLALFANASIGLAGAAYQVIDRDGKVAYTVRNDFRDWDELQAQLLFYNPFAHSSLMFRRCLFDQIEGYDESLVAACDYDFLAKASLVTEFAYSSKALVAYRRHEENMTARLSDKQRATGDAVRKRLLEHHGFVVDNQQLNLHQQIASAPSMLTAPITTKRLHEMRTWLRTLKRLNRAKKILQHSSFDRAINWVHSRLYFNPDSRLTLRRTFLTLAPDFFGGNYRNLLYTIVKSAKNGIW